MSPATVVIPVFNCARYIREAIESALAQTYADVSVLVIDDGSTDETPRILAEYERRGAVSVCRRTNGGTAAAWNFALRTARTEILVGLDADDLLRPYALEVVVRAAEADVSAAVVYSDYEFLDPDGNPVRAVSNPDPVDPVAMLLRLHDRLGEPDNFLPFGHVRLYRRSALLTAGGFDESYLYAEDFELLLRLAVLGHRFHHVDRVLYGYRWHDANKGVLGRREEVASVRRAIAEFRARGLRGMCHVDAG